MKKILKWLGFVAAGLVGLVLIAIAGVYLQSWRQFSRHYVAAIPTPIAITEDAASIAAGRHLASIHGCIACHGEQLEGTVLFDVPYVIRAVAPNISGAADKYTREQLVTVIRQGIKPDGRSAWFMPAVALRNLDDADLGRILAFVRSMPARDGIHESTSFSIGGRAYVALGGIEAHGEAEQVAAAPASPVGNLDDPVGRGHYLVMSTCIECHGQQLEGSALIGSPPLIVVKGYSRAAFGTLMHTGIALGGRPLEVMREAALMRFAHYTEQEIDDIFAFLQSRPVP